MPHTVIVLVDQCHGLSENRAVEVCERLAEDWNILGVAEAFRVIPQLKNVAMNSGRAVGKADSLV